jgi:chromosome segregation ATPase
MQEEGSGRDVRIGDLQGVEAERTRREPRLDVDATAVVPRGGMAAGTRPAAPAAGRRDLRVWALGALVVLLLVAVIVLQVRQSAMQRVVVALEARAAASVETLETQVSATRATLATTDDAVRSELDGLAAQIKRLREDQAKLQAQLARQGSALEAHDKAATKLAADLAALGKADAAVDARLRTLADGLDAVAADVARQGQTLQRVAQDADIQRLRGEVSVLGSSLRELIAEHDRRLRAGEQAMASVDAFRRQVNQTLDLHTRQIGTLSASP